MNSPELSDFFSLDPNFSLDSDGETRLSSPEDELSPARDLVLRLRVGTGRSKVAFLEATARSQQEWRDLGAQLGCEVVFLPLLWLDRLPQGATYASINVRALQDALDELAQKHGQFDVTLVIGLDLLLTRLEPEECNHFWSDLSVRFPYRPTALILTLPPAFARFGPRESAWNKVFARLD